MQGRGGRRENSNSWGGIGSFTGGDINRDGGDKGDQQAERPKVETQGNDIIRDLESFSVEVVNRR